MPDAVAALRNLNRQLAAAIADVLRGLTDDQRAFVAPALDARPFGEVVVHAYRPILAAARVVAGRDWPPRRPQPATVAALAALVAALVAEVDALLAHLAGGPWRAPSRYAGAPGRAAWMRSTTAWRTASCTSVHAAAHAPSAASRPHRDRVDAAGWWSRSGAGAPSQRLASVRRVPLTGWRCLPGAGTTEPQFPGRFVRLRSQTRSSPAAWEGEGSTPSARGAILLPTMRFGRRAPSGGRGSVALGILHTPSPGRTGE